MLTSVLLICLLGQLTVADVIRPRGVSLARKVFYDPSKDFTCIDGSLTIPFTQVNDDYCDCADGSDEPGTSACSNGKFTCSNVGYIEKEVDASKVNDGLCDCCDGSDEYALKAICANNCFELGEAAREEYRRQQEIVKAGHEVREQYKQQAKERREDIDKQLIELNAQIEKLKEEKQQKLEIKQAAEDLEKEALDKHSAEIELKRKENQKAQEVQQARDIERTNAIEAFRVLDIDQDGVITYTELITSGLFDQNSDGVTSEEEARFFLAHKEKMDLEEFINLGWILAKPFFQKQKHADEQNNQLNDAQSQDNTHQPETVSSQEIPPSAEHEHEQQPTNEAESDLFAHGEKDERESEVFDYADSNKDEYEEIDDKDEYKEEDSYKPEEHEHESEQYEYDEQTKQLIEQAKQARQEFSEVESKFHQTENRIRELQSSLAHDYGQEDEFLALQGHCFDFNDREYTYRLCPFDRASQIPKNGGGEINLGRWGRWTGPEEDKYSSFRMENGMTCWNGPPRIADVILVCGKENVIISTTEPNRCEYQFVMESPARCKLPPNEQSTQNQHTEL